MHRRGRGCRITRSAETRAGGCVVLKDGVSVARGGCAGRRNAAGGRELGRAGDHRECGSRLSLGPQPVPAGGGGGGGSAGKGLPYEGWSGFNKRNSAFKL